MPVSDLFHLEFQCTSKDGNLSYTVLRCVQWKRPNQEFMAQAAEQRFALLHADPLRDRDIRMIERAYLGGALPAVKLISILETSFELVLDSGASSTVFPVIESAWAKVAQLDPSWPLDLTYSNEAEVTSARYEHPFREQMEAIIEHHSLGIKPYDIPVEHKSILKPMEGGVVITEWGICSDTSRSTPLVSSRYDCLTCGPIPPDTKKLNALMDDWQRKS